MPIYEFYCERCNTIYNFFSRTVNTEKVPDCPRCGNVKLNRRMSLFASVSGRKESGGTDKGMPDIDEARMEKAMTMLADEANRINEEDPRQAAALMRKLSDAAGISMGAGMEEALRRLEKGEDPEMVEQEMDGLIEGEEPFVVGEKGKRGGKKPKPGVDETIYEL